MFTGPNISSDTIVFHYDASNTKSYVSGSTTWVNLNPNGDNATLVNGVEFDETIPALQFSGSDETVVSSHPKITVPNANIDAPWTMTAWFRRTFDHNNIGSIMGNSGTSPTGVGKFMGLASPGAGGGALARKPWIIVYASGSQNDLYGKTTTIINNWYNMTTTHDGTEIRIYLDGVLEASASIDGFTTSSNASDFTVWNVVLIGL
jgi:hypothetical protein